MDEAVDVGLALADVDADEVACGSSAVLVGVAVAAGLLPQGLSVASAVALLPDALTFAEAEAVAEGDVVAVLVAVLVGLAVAVLVAVAVPVELAPPLAGLVVSSAGLVAEALAAGVALGLAELAASSEGDGEVLGEHVATVALVWLLGMLAGVAPPADVPIGLPAPSVPWTPLLLCEEVIPTTVPSWTKAWRSGGNASVTPMANTAQAAAKADRSSPSRQFRGWVRARRPRRPDEPPRREFQRRILSTRNPPEGVVAPECLLAYAGPDPIRARIRSSPSGRGSNLVGGGVQGMAQELAEVVSWRRCAIVAGSAHYSCSKAARRAVIPRAVWLLTAPRLMPMLAAISASDRSA